MGLIRGHLAFPHPGRRLRLQDRSRMARMATRFAPSRCLLLDPGDRIDLPDPGRPGSDGAVHVLSREIVPARPKRVADGLFVSCGIYQPLITANRSILEVWRDAGMAVEYVESRDGHNWKSWRDRLRDGLSWVYPGDSRFFYQ